MKTTREVEQETNMNVFFISIVFTVFIVAIVGSILYELVDRNRDKINLPIEELLIEKGYELECIEYEKVKVARFETICEKPAGVYIDGYRESGQDKIISETPEICGYFRKQISSKVIEIEVNGECIYFGLKKIEGDWRWTTELEVSANK